MSYKVLFYDNINQFQDQQEHLHTSTDGLVSTDCAINDEAHHEQQLKYRAAITHMTQFQEKYPIIVQKPKINTNTYTRHCTVNPVLCSSTAAQIFSMFPTFDFCKAVVNEHQRQQSHKKQLEIYTTSTNSTTTSTVQDMLTESVPLVHEKSPYWQIMYFCAYVWCQASYDIITNKYTVDSVQERYVLERGTLPATLSADVVTDNHNNNSVSNMFANPLAITPTTTTVVKMDNAISNYNSPVVSTLHTSVTATTKRPMSAQKHGGICRNCVSPLVYNRKEDMVVCTCCSASVPSDRWKDIASSGILQYTPDLTVHDHGNNACSETNDAHEMKKPTINAQKRKRHLHHPPYLTKTSKRGKKGKKKLASGEKNSTLQSNTPAPPAPTPAFAPAPTSNVQTTNSINNNTDVSTGCAFVKDNHGNIVQVMSHLQQQDVETAVVRWRLGQLPDQQGRGASARNQTINFDPFDVRKLQPTGSMSCITKNKSPEYDPINYMRKQLVALRCDGHKVYTLLVMQDIKDHWEKYYARRIDISRLRYPGLLKILKDIGHSSEYHAVHQILYNLNGFRPPYPTDEMIANILSVYYHIYGIWSNLKGSNNSQLNYNFLLHMICYGLGYKQFLPYFCLSKTSSTLRKTATNWKKINAVLKLPSFDPCCSQNIYIMPNFTPS